MSCAVGNHEPRSFGGILQAHMETWKGSGLLSALNLLETLVWPTTSPTYTLTSSFLGTFTFDFSAWAGMLLAIRSIIIAIAGFVAYKIIFVGGVHDRLTQSDYCFLMDMIASFKDIWLLGLGLGAVTGRYPAQCGRDRVPRRAGDCGSVCVAAGRHGDVPSPGHSRGGHGCAVPAQSMPFVRWGS